jgi:RHS repeat-associated protein
VTWYVYDGDHIIAEYVNGSLTRKYIYGPGIDRPVAMIRIVSGVEYWYYYYTDVLGSVRLLTNASGAVVESYTYDPYGQPRVMYAAGTDNNWLTEDVVTYTSSHLTRGNPIMFTGRWWDSATRLYYYRFRDYSPTLGRFLQPDPAKYIDGMNLYAYCGNNPVNWIDPWGLAWYNNWDDFTNAIGNLFDAIMDAFTTVNDPGGVGGAGAGILSFMGISDDQGIKRAQGNAKNDLLKEQTPYTWDSRNQRPVYVEPQDIDGDGILNWDSNGNFQIDPGDQNICPHGGNR